MDFTKQRADLKARLDQETTERLLVFIGEPVNRNHQLKNNPSFSIRRDGLIKDFGGTGFTGDFIAFLHEQRGIPLSEAVRWVSDALGVRHE